MLLYVTSQGVKGPQSRNNNGFGQGPSRLYGENNYRIVKSGTTELFFLCFLPCRVDLDMEILNPPKLTILIISMCLCFTYPS